MCGSGAPRSMLSVVGVRRDRPSGGGPGPPAAPPRDDPMQQPEPDGTAVPDGGETAMRRSAALLTVTATVLTSALAGCSSVGSPGTIPPATQSATEQATVAATASAASSAATSAAASPS